MSKKHETVNSQRKCFMNSAIHETNLARVLVHFNQWGGSYIS